MSRRLERLQPTMELVGEQREALRREVADPAQEILHLVPLHASGEQVFDLLVGHVIDCHHCVGRG